MQISVFSTTCYLLVLVWTTCPETHGKPTQSSSAVPLSSLSSDETTTIFPDDHQRSDLEALTVSEVDEDDMEETGEEDMETAHTLLYGTSGSPYLCLPASVPAARFRRRSSNGGSKKKRRGGYSKYPWNYQ